MSWNWINTFGLITVMLILMPNIIYVCRKKYIANKCTNKILNISEQIGRYGSMILMVLNIGISELGFWSKNGFVIWLIIIPTLILLYWIVWSVYFRKGQKNSAILLAIIPGIIFILNGVLLGHWLLVISGFIFSSSHIFITYKNFSSL